MAGTKISLREAATYWRRIIAAAFKEAAGDLWSSPLKFVAFIVALAAGIGTWLSGLADTLPTATLAAAIAVAAVLIGAAITKIILIPVREHKAQSAAIAKLQAPYGTLVIECDTMQCYLPASDAYPLLALMRSVLKDGRSGFMRKSRSAHFPATPYDVPGIRFRLTNYSPQTLTNVQIQLRLHYSEAIHDGPTTRSGDTIAEGPSIITIPKIDSGVGNSHEFYCTGEGECFIMLYLPSDGTGVPVDEKVPRKLDIRHTYPHGVLVPPRFSERQPLKSPEITTYAEPPKG